MELDVMSSTCFVSQQQRASFSDHPIFPGHFGSRRSRQSGRKERTVSSFFASGHFLSLLISTAPLAPFSALIDALKRSAFEWQIQLLTPTPMNSSRRLKFSWSSPRDSQVCPFDSTHHSLTGSTDLESDVSIVGVDEQLAQMSSTISRALKYVPSSSIASTVIFPASSQ